MSSSFNGKKASKLTGNDWASLWVCRPVGDWTGRPWLARKKVSKRTGQVSAKAARKASR